MNLAFLLVPLLFLLVLILWRIVTVAVTSRDHEIMVTPRLLKVRQQFEILRHELPVAKQILAELSRKNPPQVTQVLQERLLKIDLTQLDKVYTQAFKCCTSFQKKEDIVCELTVLEDMFADCAKIIGEAIRLPHTIDIARQESKKILASLPEHIRPTELIIVHDNISLDTKNQFRSAIHAFQTARIEALESEKMIDWIAFLFTIKKIYATFQTIHAHAVVERGYAGNARVETIPFEA